jgi:hypothetical protein
MTKPPPKVHVHPSEGWGTEGEDGGQKGDCLAGGIEAGIHRTAWIPAKITLAS